MVLFPCPTQDIFRTVVGAVPYPLIKFQIIQQAVAVIADVTIVCIKRNAITQEGLLLDRLEFLCPKSDLIQ